MKSDYLFFEGVAGEITRRAPRPEPRKPRWSAAEAPQQLDGFFSALLGRVAVNAGHYRASALVRRTGACLRTLGAATVEQGLEELRDRPELTDAALNSVLLGVTDFFRDRAVFERLRFSILPELMRRQARLRIWSAACSQGHELYSVAMLLAEEGRLEQAELLGTDCRSDAIRQAQGGAFCAQVVAKLPAHWRRNFFSEGAVTSRIDPTLQRNIRWKSADLFSVIEPGPWHVILWRNMAIYLEPPAAEQIFNGLCRELAPGGYLVTGKADHLPPGLGLTRVGTCLYQKPVAPL